MCLFVFVDIVHHCLNDCTAFFICLNNYQYSFNKNKIIFGFFKVFCLKLLQNRVLRYHEHIWVPVWAYSNIGKLLRNLHYRQNLNRDS